MTQVATFGDNMGCQFISAREKAPIKGIAVTTVFAVLLTCNGRVMMLTCRCGGHTFINSLYLCESKSNGEKPMPNFSSQDKEAKIAKVYHRKSNLDTTTDPLFINGDEIISGDDDRRDIFTLEDSSATEALQKKLACSTVILTKKGNLSSLRGNSLFQLLQQHQQRCFIKHFDT